MLDLHGHGQRERQVRGPLEIGKTPRLAVLSMPRPASATASASG